MFFANLQKIGGFFGGGNANLVPDEISRLIFHAITFVVMIFAGWLSLLAAIKDRRMLKGSISNHKCSFTIKKNNSLFTCRVKGDGLTFVDVFVCLLDNSNEGNEKIALEISFKREGRKDRRRIVLLQAGEDISPCEFVICGKDKWESLLSVDCSHEVGNPQECQIELVSYFGVGRPVSLLNFTDDAT